MMKQLIIIIVLIIAQKAFAQSTIIGEAKIEFERQTNVWAELSGDFADRIRQSTPQYKTSQFSFISDGKKSLYSPIPGKETDNRGFFFGATMNDNIVYTDFQNKTSVSLKNVFEKTYLLEDSLRQASWKITNDFREIAGFNCRRATTIIMDSVFVVAFYTDEIMIPGGPESFTGLPGMIMGLVINRLHTTWYATKVSVTDFNGNSIVPPKGKAEKTSRAKLGDLLRKTFTNWGRNADRNIWSALI